MNFAISNGLVMPNRFSVSPAAATIAPSAMSSVAGTREWMLPRAIARVAAGSEATRLTAMATGEIRRLNRNWSPDCSGSREYPRTRRLGMNTYAENSAPRISAKAPVTFMNGVSSRSTGGNRVATG